MKNKEIKFLRQYAPLLLTLMIGTVLSILSFKAVKNWEQRQAHSEFERRASNQAITLQKGLNNTLELLQSIKGLYEASETVDRLKFKAFVSDILQRYPEIQALEWIPRVPNSKRKKYETAARKDGLANFQISEKKAQGEMVRAAKRSEYYPVYFVEPLQGNERAVGFDLASNPTRLAALNKSSESGGMVASARITLVQETAEQYGMLVFLPVYGKNAGVKTLADRRKNLIGFVLGVFRVGDMISKILGQLNSENLVLNVYDESAREEEQFLFCNGDSPCEQKKSPKQESSNLKELTWEAPLQVGGRSWVAHFSPEASFVASENSWQAVVVLAGGLLLTFLALTYFFTNIRHTASIESQVEERTAEVVQTNKALEEEISVRRRAEEELKDKEMLLENILENTMAGYWDWFIKEDYEYMSPTFKKMFGYDDDELPNKPESWQKIIHPDDLSGVFEVFEKHVQTKGEFSFDNEVRYYHKNGSVVWVYCKGKVIEWDENGEPIRMVGSHINITDLKAAEEQLKKQTEELSQALEDLAKSQTDLAQNAIDLANINKTLKEEIKERKRADVVLREHAEKLTRSNEELEQFAYVASHDLQEPLRKVTSFSELLAKKYRDQLDSKADKYIDYVVDGAARMQTLIRDLLSFSRLGQVEIKIEPTKLESAVSEALSTLDIPIHESKAEISFDSLPEVNANASQITQLFQNLIANAIKYRSEANPCIKISAEQQNSHWQISVSDNGIGIGPEYSERIFVIFQRLHTREEYTGTGVGLAICKKIVERHDGRIWVESEPGKGSTFYFTLHKNLENRKVDDKAPEIQVIDDDLSGIELTAKS